MRVGFIGLGLMGKLMSANLVRAGFDVRSFDLNGSGNCKTAKQAAEQSQILITMVPDGKAVRKAVLAALPGLARGAIVIDMSSSDPATTRGLGVLLKKKGVHMLDSPVSGAKAKAADGTLALMVGGDAALLERARPVLSAMGTEIFHTGGLGSGHTTKALNNYLGAARTVGVAAPYLERTAKLWKISLNRLPEGADHTEIYRYLKTLRPPSRGAASPRKHLRRKPRRPN